MKWVAMKVPDFNSFKKRQPFENFTDKVVAIGTDHLEEIKRN